MHPVPQVGAPTPAELDALPADRRLELLELQQQRRDRDRDRADAARDRRRQTLHQWINSGVLLIGAVLAGGSLLATAATLRTGESELHTTREGQFTERYAKATEQLGSSKREVRTAAVYALERVAADSQRDRPTIRNVLAAYVREHDPAPTVKPAHLPEEPDTDVAAALAVLTRRTSGFHAAPGHPDVSLPLDLHQVRIPGAYFAPGADLSDASLSEANLSGADLTSANLIRANLSAANLIGANLDRAYLTEAGLNQADLTDAYLAGASLSGAQLFRVDLTRADLTGANLSGAMLDGNLSEVNLTGANLSAADLSLANLHSANLLSANLSGANLSGANLSGANLSGVNLTGANLTGLKGATEAEIRRYAKVDGNTTFG
ncbi:pentapeptide repeat-containing protein [Actinomadura sp. 1N219]|uniref:pentapeptide repeat-containing protein n=1 Tax=Actinomadura sp. 1N219 TaxID=3375152 RepID=UPI0037B8C692